MLTVPHYWQVKNTAFIEASSIHVILFQIRYHTSLSVPPLACPVEKKERERERGRVDNGDGLAVQPVCNQRYQGKWAGQNIRPDRCFHRYRHNQLIDWFEKYHLKLFIYRYHSCANEK